MGYAPDGQDRFGAHRLVGIAESPAGDPWQDGRVPDFAQGTRGREADVARFIVERQDEGRGGHAAADPAQGLHALRARCGTPAPQDAHDKPEAHGQAPADGYHVVHFAHVRLHIYRMAALQESPDFH